MFLLSGCLALHQHVSDMLLLKKGSYVPVWVLCHQLHHLVAGTLDLCGAYRTQELHKMGSKSHHMSMKMKMRWPDCSLCDITHLAHLAFCIASYSL